MIKIFTFSSSDGTLEEFQNEINDYIEKNHLAYDDFEIKVVQSESANNVDLTVMLIRKK